MESEEEAEESESEPKINMEIGIGVYDVLNGQEGCDDDKIDNFIPKSTEQIVKIKSDQVDPGNIPKPNKSLKMAAGGNPLVDPDNSSDSSDSDSEDNDLFMNFDSSDDQNEIIDKIKKLKMKTHADDQIEGKAAKKPFIIDITDQKAEEKLVGQKRQFKEI